MKLWPFNITFADTKTKKPIMQEQGKSERSAMGSMTKDIELINDDLTQKSGTQIYDELRHDPDVKSGLTVKIGGVLSKGWELTIDEELGKVGEDRVEFVQYNFDNMPGSLDDRLEEILRDLLGCGTSISEKIWAYADDGDYKGKVLLGNFKVKDPDVFLMDVDEFNNITDLKLNLAGSKISVDLAKFAIATYQAEHGEPFGTSDLRAAYYWFRLKKMWVKWWACYAEKYGMPTAKATVPSGTSLEKKQELLAVLSKIQQETAIVVEEDQIVELLTANQSGSGSNGDYQSAIDYFSKQIVKSILGQTLTSDEGQRVGSLALGKVHQDVLSIYIRKLKRMIEEYVDEQIIRDIVDFNFNDKIYPNFTLSLDEKDLASLSEVFFRLTQSEIVDPNESWVREYLGLPAKEENIETNDNNGNNDINAQDNDSDANNDMNNGGDNK